ncbi:hypothetical protein [Chelonobacter oris]|uniref:hypothetical protein n=1 Tax=Chelonobacter oris TaxID=505317 RepID=UPI00137767A6|nr:hypothetical protein [Chelonobacter oris]
MKWRLHRISSFLLLFIYQAIQAGDFTQAPLITLFESRSHEKLKRWYKQDIKPF